MKKQLLSYGLMVMMCAGLFVSCSQDETDVAAGAATQAEAQPNVTTVAELTARLRNYNADVYGVTRGTRAWGNDNQQVNATNRKLGIVTADVSGALKGWKRFGWRGAVIGGSAYSLLKLLTNWLKPLFTNKPLVIYPSGNAVSVRDSIGYYHNVLERETYRIDSNSNLLSSTALLERMDSIMRKNSDGYAAAGTITQQNLSALAADTDEFVATDRDDLSFDDYCDLQIANNPEQADYINFVAEYLFVVFYGNVDVDEYTGEVLFMINHSNADVGDAALLNSAIQVAYASSQLPLGETN